MTVFTLMLTAGAEGAEPGTGPCADPRHREFDFWAGHWRVLDGAGSYAGDNVISVEEGGCVLVERWRGAKGGTGQSLNYFDPAAGVWKQRWVGLGLILEMQGKLADGAMVLQGALHYVREGRTTWLRGTWTPLTDGRVRQHFEESEDQGQTWKEWFDGYYSRAPGSPSPRHPTGR